MYTLRSILGRSRAILFLLNHRHYGFMPSLSTAL